MSGACPASVSDAEMIENRQLTLQIKGCSIEFEKKQKYTCLTACEVLKKVDTFWVVILV